MPSLFEPVFVLWLRLYFAMSDIRRKQTRFENSQIDIDLLDRIRKEQRAKIKATRAAQDASTHAQDVVMKDPVVPQTEWQRTVGNKSVQERLGMQDSQDRI